MCRKKILMQVREYIKFYYIEIEIELFFDNLILRILYVSVDTFEIYDVRNYKSI